MIHVLDAGPMIAFLDAKQGDAVVTQALIDNPSECFAHVFNLTKVFYIFFRRAEASATDTVIQTLLDAGIVPAKTPILLSGRTLGRSKAPMRWRCRTPSASRWLGNWAGPPSRPTTPSSIP